MFKRLAPWALLGIALAVLGLACGQPRTDVYLIGDPQGDWGFPAPFSHNPRGPGYLRVSFLFDTLIWKDVRGFVPALAQSWHYDSQTPAYVFQLRPGVLWHDGQPLTAADVAFTFNYLKRHPHPWVDIRPVQAVEAINSLTVRVTLTRPYAPFLEEIAGSMFILPQHIWQGVEEPGRFQEPRATIGTGPYKFADYRREHGLYRFVAFERYYQGRPTVPVIGFVQVGNELLALKGKAIQAAAIPPEAAAEVRGLGFTVATQPHFWCLKLLFNHQKFPMQEPAFGRAILLESSLAFLGLADPHHKSWGVMIQYGLKFIALGDYWLWWLLPPAMALGLTLISLALIGFGLESRFEPTLRR